MNITKKFAIVVVIAIILPTIALAAPASNGCTDAGTTNNLGRCVNQIYIWSLAAAAILALFMIVIGGYITMTAAGNAERASRGKNYIQSSLIGLVLLIGAYVLLNTINPDLVNFNPTTFSDTTTPVPTPTANPPRSP
jgi:hypothetical protein